MKKRFFIVLVVMLLFGAMWIWQYHRSTVLHFVQEGMRVTFSGETVDSNISLSGGVGSNHGTLLPLSSIIGEEGSKLSKSTRALLSKYNDDPREEYLFELVESLSNDGAFSTAAYLYQILVRDYPESVDYSDYLRLLLNGSQYTTGFTVEYQQTINSLLASGLISKEDATFFTSFSALIATDVDTFYQNVYQLTGAYSSIAQDLIANLQTYSQYVQAPKQYLWGLFASTLLRYGYYRPALHLAQQSLLLNKDYILGLQVAAYSHMMMHDWSQSKTYLEQLLTLDPSHLLTYQRLYGIISYRHNEHQDAIWYLSQVYNKIPDIELLRYLGLSYRALYDYIHVTSTYRTLLGSQEILDIDYFEFFDTYRRSVGYTSGMIFLPTTNPIDRYDNKLLDDYIQQCLLTIGTGSFICQYGVALDQLFASNVTGAIEIMSTVIPNHPYDFAYGMMGDMYLINGNSALAQAYYKNAISASYNGGYQRYLSNKISQLIDDRP